jgi:hypothetical protein
VIVVFVLACAPRQPPQDPAARPIDWVSVAEQQAAMEVWHRLAPTGRNLEEVVGEIPDRANDAMAFALIRDDGFTCPRPDHNALERDAVSHPDETLGDPCLRSDLLVRLVQRSGALALPRDVLEAIAAAVDHRVVDFLAEKLDEQTKLELIAATAPDRRVDLGAHTLLDRGSPEMLARAIRVYHLAEAVGDVFDRPELLLDAAVDREMPTWGRSAALNLLFVVGPPPAESDALDAALVDEATTSPDCELAMAAARGLAAFGHTRTSPIARAPPTSP